MQAMSVGHHLIQQVQHADSLGTVSAASELNDQNILALPDEIRRTCDEIGRSHRADNGIASQIAWYGGENVADEGGRTRTTKPDFPDANPFDPITDFRRLFNKVICPGAPYAGLLEDFSPGC
ncbi:hypothetical protein [Rhizobium sp. NRK18]|uniref:hypothetical protein n=1 Tax=Rhizobium sp. NRK18 TaxID=2964667 RepID=UPI00396598A5